MNRSILKCLLGVCLCICHVYCVNATGSLQENIPSDAKTALVLDDYQAFISACAVSPVLNHVDLDTIFSNKFVWSDQKDSPSWRMIQQFIRSIDGINGAYDSIVSGAMTMIPISDSEDGWALLLTVKDPEKYRNSVQTLFLQSLCKEFNVALASNSRVAKIETVSQPFKSPKGELTVNINRIVINDRNVFIAVQIEDAFVYVTDVVVLEKIFQATAGVSNNLNSADGYSVNGADMVTSSGSIVFFTSDTSVHNVVFLSKLASQYKALKCKVVLSEDGFKFDISASHPIGTMVKDLMVDGDGKNARLFDSIVTSDTEVLVSCSGISYPAIFKFIEQERDWVTSMGITRLNTMLKTSINQDLRTISEGLDDDILYLRHKNGTHSYAFGVKDARKLKKTGLVVKEKVDDSLARYSRRNRIRPWLQLDESEFLGFKEYTIPVQSDISGSNSTLALALNHLILSNRKSGVEHFISLFVENREEKRDALHNLYVYIDSNVLKQLAVRLSLPEDFIKKCLGASFKAALSDDTLQIEAELFCREK